MKQDRVNTGKLCAQTKDVIMLAEECWGEGGGGNIKVMAHVTALLVYKVYQDYTFSKKSSILKPFRTSFLFANVGYLLSEIKLAGNGPVFQ